MSLLSTDWHINQMKKRAYESDPLPINMRESVYRSGSRDYVLINSNDNTKYKSNALRLRIQDKLTKLKSSLSSLGSTNNSAELANLVQQAYWLNDIAASLKIDDEDYKSKDISNNSKNLIQSGYNLQNIKIRLKGFWLFLVPQVLSLN